MKIANQIIKKEGSNVTSVVSSNSKKNSSLEINKSVKCPQKEGKEKFF